MAHETGQSKPTGADGERNPQFQPSEQIFRLDDLEGEKGINISDNLETPQPNNQELTMSITDARQYLSNALSDLLEAITLDEPTFKAALRRLLNSAPEQKPVATIVLNTPPKVFIERVTSGFNLPYGISVFDRHVCFARSAMMEPPTKKEEKKIRRYTYIPAFLLSDTIEVTKPQGEPKTEVVFSAFLTFDGTGVSDVQGYRQYVVKGYENVKPESYWMLELSTDRNHKVIGDDNELIELAETLKPHFPGITIEVRLSGIRKDKNRNESPSIE